MVAAVYQSLPIITLWLSAAGGKEAEKGVSEETRQPPDQQRTTFADLPIPGPLCLWKQLSSASVTTALPNLVCVGAVDSNVWGFLPGLFSLASHPIPEIQTFAQGSFHLPNELQRPESHMARLELLLSLHVHLAKGDVLVGET